MRDERDDERQDELDQLHALRDGERSGDRYVRRRELPARLQPLESVERLRDGGPEVPARYRAEKRAERGVVELWVDRQRLLVVAQQAAGLRPQALDHRDDVADAHHGAAQVVNLGSLVVEAGEFDDRAGDVVGVLKVEPATERDAVRDAEDRGLHRMRRRGGEPLVAAVAVEGPWANSGARDTEVVPEDASDLVVVSPRRVEHAHRPDDVDVRATRGVGRDEWNLERR